MAPQLTDCFFFGGGVHTREDEAAWRSRTSSVRGEKSLTRGENSRRRSGEGLRTRMRSPSTMRAPSMVTITVLRRRRMPDFWVFSPPPPSIFFGPGPRRISGFLDPFGHEMGGRYEDLMTQLESAKNKLEEVEAKRSDINIASSKSKELVEQLKHQIESVPSALKEMDDNALEEEYKALMGDKSREMEYLHSLEDQINQLEGISQVVTCQCGEEYRVELMGKSLGLHVKQL